MAVVMVFTCVAFPVPNTVNTPNSAENGYASQCQCFFRSILNIIHRSTDPISHRHFSHENAPQGLPQQTSYTYRAAQKSTSRIPHRDHRWQLLRLHRQYFRFQLLPAKCRTDRLKRCHSAPSDSIFLIKNFSEWSTSLHMGIYESAGIVSVHSNSRPTPIMQIIAGTPQMKLFTTAFTDLIISNILSTSQLICILPVSGQTYKV